MFQNNIYNDLVLELRTLTKSEILPDSQIARIILRLII